MPGNTDAFLWYNVGQWAEYGLAVPNWSDDNKSQNNAIRDLVQVIGRNLSAVMWHTDARLSSRCSSSGRISTLPSALLQSSQCLAEAMVCNDFARQN